MNAFDLPEIPESVISWGVKGLIVVGLVAVGTIAYKVIKKAMNMVELHINGYKFEGDSVTLNVTVENLKESKIFLVFHFEYKDFSSKKFTVNLAGKQTKIIDIVETGTPWEKDGMDVDKSQFKLVVDETKFVK